MWRRGLTIILQVRVGLATKAERASRQQRTYQPNSPNQSRAITNNPHRQAAQEPPEDPPWYRQGEGCQGQEGQINDLIFGRGRKHTTRHHDWALMDMALYLQSAWKFGPMAWVAEQNGCNETFSVMHCVDHWCQKGDRCSINMLANTNTKKNDPRLDLEHFDPSTPTCTAIIDRTRWKSLRQEQDDGGFTRRLGKWKLCGPSSTPSIAQSTRWF